MRTLATLFLCFCSASLAADAQPSEVRAEMSTYQAVSTKAAKEYDASVTAAKRILDAKEDQAKSKAVARLRTLLRSYTKAGDLSKGLEAAKAIYSLSPDDEEVSRVLKAAGIGLPTTQPSTHPTGVNLLRSDKLKIRALSGKWKLTDREMMTEGKVGREPARLLLAYKPTIEYELAVAFTADSQETVMLNLPTPIGQVAVQVNGYGKDAGFDGEPTVQHPLPGGVRHTVVVRVRKDSLELEADEKVLVTVVPGPRHVLRTMCDTPIPSGVIALGTHVVGKVVFHEVSVTPLSSR